MKATIRPGTPEWESLREQIVDLEAEAIEATNTARDALLAQGDLFQQIAPLGDRPGPNGTGRLLEQMARECGIAVRTAANRRDMAANLPAGGEIRTLLQEANDVQLSFETLRTILADDQPEALLARLIEEARRAGSGRITRDAARRLRGHQTGTVGTPEATAERIARDPEFAERVAADPETARVLGTMLGRTDAGVDAVLSGYQQRPSEQARRRTTSERQAAQSAAEDVVYHFRTHAVMALLMGLDGIVTEVTTEGDGRDYELDETGSEHARMVADVLEGLATRLRAWAKGDTTDPWDRSLADLLGGDPQ